MNILDENITRSQRELLHRFHVSVRQVGYDVGKKGMKDDELITFLQQHRKVTFFTRDSDFYEYYLCHSSYCLVCMDIEKYEVAIFVRQFIHHREFDTEAKRMGTVVRISHTGILAWRPHVEKEVKFIWNK